MEVAEARVCGGSFFFSHLYVCETEDLDAAGQPLGHQLTVHRLHDHQGLHRVLFLRHAAQDQPHLVGHVAEHRGDGGWETPTRPKISSQRGDG